MKTITVKTTKSTIKEIADIIDLNETTPVKVKDLYFTLGYFSEFPELQQYLDIQTFNRLKHGNIEAIQFVEIK